MCLLSKRNYKNVMEDGAALKMIVQSSAVLFDPKVVAAFEMKFNEIIKVKNAMQESGK